MSSEQTSNNHLQELRHSLAHLLAAAVLKHYPDAKPTIGPAIDDGFYYDFDFSTPISADDLPRIEGTMKELLRTWDMVSTREVVSDEAKKTYTDNPYKLELIDEIVGRGENITFYKWGEFEDLCRGGHIESAKQIDPSSFKLSRLAGAYWRGSEKNKMLTRIYGFAFGSKKELEAHLTMLKEAEKRDHKKLGKEFGLLMFHETAPGMPYWLPKGLILYNELVQFWRKEHRAYGYKEIASPLVNKAELWKTSGHWDHYRDDMFVADMGEHEVYGIKPMNCPNAMLVFQSMQVSYKDLPLRLSDTDRLHRYERSGTLNGLFRCRSFQQDDSHNYICEDMIFSEYAHIFEVCKKFYGIFNLSYSFRLGTRPEKFLGEQATWDKAEAALRTILDRSGVSYFVAEGDGAFYGPKVDILMKDSLGRDWQMGTVQLDFQQPLRFGLEYTDKDGKKKTPVVVHRVIYGSLERFIGILIEHTAGAFPVWLSPVQIIFLPVSEKHCSVAQTIAQPFLNAEIRVEIDESNETVGAKIRCAEKQKIPYMVVVGDKEAAGEALQVRIRGQKDMPTLSPQELLNRINDDVRLRR